MEQSARRTIKPFPSTFRQNGEPAYRLNGETMMVKGSSNTAVFQSEKRTRHPKKNSDENYSVAVNTNRRKNSMNSEPISGN